MSQISFMAHRIPRVTLVSDRSGFIAEACKGRSVLHLGCAEWPLTAQSLQDGKLLHLAISKVSKRVFGIDSSEQGLQLLRASGFTDLIRWDVEKLDELRIDQPLDVIVAGEILEHLANPGLCLQGIAQFMRPHQSKLIVSVPSAFSLRHFISFMFQKTELVMPDHTAYYSFTTLSELLHRYGFNVLQLCAYSNSAKNSRPLRRFLKLGLDATLFRVFPQVSEGIIAVARLGN